MTTLRACALLRYIPVIMPVPGFLQSFADKAQSAINASPLGSLTQQNSGGSASNRSHTIESISNQLRVMSQQYSYVHPRFVIAITHHLLQRYKSHTEGNHRREERHPRLS